MQTGALRPRHIRIAAWWFTLPALLFQFFFGWFPILIAFLVAFQRYYFAKPADFVGMENFRAVVQDPLTLEAFKNTFLYAILSLGLTFFVPIFVSILLMEMKQRTIRWMMILWFIPVASMAGIVIWKYMYHPTLGLLNGLLMALHLPTQKWLDDPNLAMLSLVLPGLIMFGPGLMYIAALQSIPAELYEAAELEGARFFQKIRFVTMPRLRPIIAMMLIFSVIGVMQVFELPFVMTGGGPGYATTTVVMQIYNQAFSAFNLGKATALAIVLFFVIMTIVIIQRRVYREDLDVS
ncbi:MAG TPA: sugar ABC transporter permease [Chthonomonadaceae bacterium]|nr:sugar ABC transporter permease [Chthonomonadaceae bacterium]